MLNKEWGRFAATFALATAFLVGGRAAVANATVAYTCDNGQRVAAKDYAIGLILESAKRISASELSINAIVLMRPDRSLQKKFYPVMEPRKLGCKNFLAQIFPPFSMKVSGAGANVADQLKAHLSGSQSRVDWGDANWDGTLPVVLLFDYVQPFKPLPSNFSSASENSVKDLLTDYFQYQSSASFLAGFDGTVSVRSDQKLVASYPGSQDTSAAVQTAEATRLPEEFRGSSAKVAANGPAPKAGKGAAAVSPGPNSARTVPLTSASAKLTPKMIAIRFRNPEAWLPAMSNPGTVNTFGYCGSGIPTFRDGVYQLTCNVAGDGKVALKINGFRTLLIDGSEPALDDRLEVVGFAVPYPENWNRPRSDLVQVRGGTLREVLAGQVSLSQGLEAPDCTATIPRLTVSDIFGERVTWPEAPCRPIEIKFPSEGLATDARVSNCLPGISAPVDIRNGTVTCWRKTTASTSASQIAAHLAAGFAPVNLPISPEAVAQGVVEFTGEQLAQYLQLQWPYVPGIVSQSDEAPVYLARDIQFRSASNQPCGGSVVIVPGGALPKLSDAGCTRIPARVEVLLVQTGQTRGAAPLDAFQPEMRDNIVLATLSGPKSIPVDDLKLELPIRFSAEDAAAYENRFGRAAGNTLSRGVSVFQRDCNGLSQATLFAPFDVRPAGKSKWPIYGAVYDGTSDESLTRCAKAIVAGTPEQPYFTFKLEAARAIGPRRAIVIASGQKFISAGGGGSTALVEAMQQFVDRITEAKNRQAPLSPINVYLVTGTGDYAHLFTGEMAAFDPATVKQLIQARKETSAPSTPDFSLVQFLPQLKQFDRITFIMDGSEVNQANLGALSLWTAQFNKNGNENVNLVLSSNSCAIWKKDIQNVSCETLPANFDGKKSALISTMSKFIIATGAQAALPQAEETQTAPAPSPRPRGRP